jgi:hypothetical protein
MLVKSYHRMSMSNWLMWSLRWHNISILKKTKIKKKSTTSVNMHFLSIIYWLATAKPRRLLHMMFFLVSRFVYFFPYLNYGFSGKIIFLKFKETLIVLGSYKRCTFWFELETYNADLKSFTITLWFLET